jgi:nitrogen fixation/metabolism regulation signal transduction histidine kinase
MKYIIIFLSNTYLLSSLFLISIGLGIISLQTFIGVGFFKLNQFNLEVLLILNFLTLIFLIISILLKIYNSYSKKKSKELGNDTSKNLVVSFLIISSLPSLLIVIFSILYLTTVFKNGLMIKYFL